MADPKPGTGEILLQRLDDTLTAPKLPKSLSKRCLELTATFETGQAPPECFGVVTGDFDGQGISYGCLQWNIGTGSLQKLVLDAEEQHPGLCESVMGALGRSMVEVFTARSRSEQLAWAKSFQSQGKYVIGKEEKAFNALGQTAEMQQAQVTAAQKYYNIALGWVASWGLRTERGVALAFDIAVQNRVGNREMGDIKTRIGSISVDRQYLAWEIEAMGIVADVVANGSLDAWVADVLNRKMAIVDGEGVVHQRRVVVADYGIRYVAADLANITT